LSGKSLNFKKVQDVTWFIQSK